MCGIIFACFFEDEACNQETLKEKADLIKHRGPDETKYSAGENYYFAFHRLAINDLTSAGSQPFVRDNIILVCNGEIYNSLALQKKYDIAVNGHSDCEILIPLYQKLGIKFVEELDGVFAIVIYDTIKKEIIACRDPIGVRPLFYGKKGKSVIFASEWKALKGLVETEAKQFPPNSVLVIGESDNAIENWSIFNSKMKLSVPRFTEIDMYAQLRSLLIDAVRKRVFMSDRPIGFLLSGGLDSSLIASIGAHCIREVHPEAKIHTYSIGLEGSQDLVMARKVADFIKSDHQEVVFKVEEGIEAIDKVIYCLESYDTTTIRASIPQFLLCEWIKKNTDVRVLFSGEGADELMAGYYYFKHAPKVEMINPECQYLVNELYQFDVLRTDRTTAGNGLEVRVPFLDIALSHYLLNELPSSFKKSGGKVLEKSVIRNAFFGWLPKEVLWRPKDAFSDSVGRKWRNGLIEYAKTKTDYNKELRDITSRVYGCKNVPRTEEEFLYRAIFEKYYPQCGSLINHFWMPTWTGTDENVNDPSAVVIGMSEERSEF